MNWETAEKELLKDPKVRKAYEKVDLSYAVSKMIIDARILRGITQTELAKRLNTKPPAVSRLESGNYLPSLRYLQRITNALDMKLIIGMEEK